MIVGSNAVGWFAMGFFGIFGFGFCCYEFGWGLWPVVVVGDLGWICSGGGGGFQCGGELWIFGIWVLLDNLGFDAVSFKDGARIKS